MITTLMPGHGLDSGNPPTDPTMSIRGGKEDNFLYLVSLGTTNSGYSVEYWINGTREGSTWVEACETPDYDEAVAAFWSVYQLRLWSSK